MKPYIPKPRRKVQKFRKCAYCGKREYNLATLVPVGNCRGSTIRNECHFAHRKCADEAP